MECRTDVGFDIGMRHDLAQPHGLAVLKGCEQRRSVAAICHHRAPREGRRGNAAVDRPALAGRRTMSHAAPSSTFSLPSEAELILTGR